MKTYVQSYETLAQAKEAEKLLLSRGIDVWQLGKDMDGLWYIGYAYEI